MGTVTIPSQWHVLKAFTAQGAALAESTIFCFCVFYDFCGEKLFLTPLLCLA
jgi:hypothetical protein